VLFRNPKYLRALHKKLAFVSAELPQGKRILELGVGHGPAVEVLLGHLRPKSYVGIDLALKPLLSFASKFSERSKISLIQASAEELPLRSESFDGIFSIDVLHHLSAPERALSEARRVLREGGRFISLEPNPLFPVNLMYIADRFERGLFRFTRRRARLWAKRAGFREIYVLDLPIFLPGPTQGSRFCDLLERGLSSLPLLGRVSTTRALLARR